MVELIEKIYEEFHEELTEKDLENMLQKNSKTKAQLEIKNMALLPKRGNGRTRASRSIANFAMAPSTILKCYPQPNALKPRSNKNSTLESKRLSESSALIVVPAKA